jgi:hypothetical protein
MELTNDNKLDLMVSLALNILDIKATRRTAAADPLLERLETLRADLLLSVPAGERGNVLSRYVNILSAGGF